MDHPEFPRAYWHRAALSGAGKSEWRAEDLSWDVYRDTIAGAAEQGVDI